MKKFNVAVVGFPNAMALDFVGPLDVFAYASQLVMAKNNGQGAPYTPRLYSLDGKPFRAVNGMQVMPDGSINDIDCSEPTVLVLSGGEGVASVLADEAFLHWLRQHAARFDRVLSVCTGSFILAQAGLLAGKSATTHWMGCDLMQHLYPDIQVSENAIYVRDGNIYTSAGASTGIDLALAVVMEDCGRELAMQVAQHLVLYLHRPGGQRQFSPVMAVQSRQRASFSELVIWMAEHLQQPLDLESLADRACMSARHFSRRFQQETGLPPMRFLNRLRLEHSRTLLEQGHLSIQAVAAQCGFQSAETFRRQFHEHYGLSPVHYQGRF